MSSRPPRLMDEVSCALRWLRSRSGPIRALTLAVLSLCLLPPAAFGQAARKRGNPYLEGTWNVGRNSKGTSIEASSNYVPFRLYDAQPLIRTNLSFSASGGIVSLGIQPTAETLKFFDQEQGGNLVTSFQWDTDDKSFELPIQLWMEATAVSSQEKDITLTVTAGPRHVFSKATAVKVEVIAHQPGTLADSGAQIARPAQETEEDAYLAIIPPNTDNDDGDPEPEPGEEPPRDNDDQEVSEEDDDLVMVLLRLEPRNMAGGRVRVRLPASMRAFDQEGNLLSEEDLSVDLSDGGSESKLKNINTEDVRIFVETTEAEIGEEEELNREDLDLSVTYTAPDGSVVRDRVFLLPLEIKWEAIDGWDNVDDNKSPVDFEYRHNVPPADGRWLPGRGRRVFTDKKNKDDYIRNQVMLKIDTAPNVTPGNKLYLKAFDVDDATPEDFDSSREIDTDGKGNDNKDQDATRLKTGQFIIGGQKKGAATEVTLDANGDASVIFETTMQPGDNFRVALAFKQEDLNALQADNPGATGFVEGKSDQQPSGFSGGIVSPLLTVWRKLNVEIDSMQAVPSPRGAPDEWQPVGREWTISVPPVEESSLALDNTIGLSDKVDFYVGGTITGGGMTLDIIRSTPNSVTVATRLTAQQQQAFIGTVTIKDDDMRGLPTDFSPLLARSALITEGVIRKYIPAYVLIRDAATENPRKIIPFELNEDVGFLTDLDDFQDLPDSAGYWAHLVVAAYQGPIDSDGDPKSEVQGGATEGTTFNQSYYGTQFHHSGIYLEAIRDNLHRELNYPPLAQGAQATFKDRVYGTVAHEIGHVPPPLTGSETAETDHQEGGLMGDGNTDLSDFTFNPPTINRFRTTKSWTKKQ